MGAHDNLLDALRADATKLDDLYYQLADVLDVKASIILVLVTLLGTISGQVLALKDLSPALKYLQVLSVLSLGIAVVLTILALRISRFYGSPSPEDWARNLSDWQDHYAPYEHAGDLIWEHFTAVRDELTLERIKLNRQLTQKKSSLNRWALRATTCALAFEFLTLALLALPSYSG